MIYTAFRLLHVLSFQRDQQLLPNIRTGLMTTARILIMTAWESVMKLKPADMYSRFILPIQMGLLKISFSLIRSQGGTMQVSGWDLISQEYLRYDRNELG